MFFPDLGLFMSLSFQLSHHAVKSPFEDIEGGTFLQFQHSGGGGEQRTAWTT